jgi:hypothetical protein
MKALFTAYTCEPRDSQQNRILLPGVGASCSLEANDQPLKKGDRIRLELPDGSSVETDVLGIQANFLERKSMPFHLEDAFIFYAPCVPADFCPNGIELGAKVFLIDREAQKA